MTIPKTKANSFVDAIVSFAEKEQHRGLASLQSSWWRPISYKFQPQLWNSPRENHAFEDKLFMLRK